MRKGPCRRVAGQAVYLYAVAIMFQIIVYPAFAFAAWSSKGFSGDWLTQGWTSSPLGETMRHERHFMYSLFGYMFKDMFIFINDPMFFAHHAICIVGMLCIFATPAGLGTFILGAVTLELGTFTFNVVLLCGKDAPDDVPPSVKHFAECLYGFGMPFTNVVGVALWLSFASQEGLRGTLWVWGFGACWTALIIGEVCFVQLQWCFGREDDDAWMCCLGFGVQGSSRAGEGEGG